MIITKQDYRLLDNMILAFLDYGENSMQFDISFTLLHQRIESGFLSDMIVLDTLYNLGLWENQQ